MSEQIFSGVPRALVLDSWWMSGDAEFEAPRSKLNPTGFWRETTRRRLLLLVALLATADVLFFQQVIGLSLAIFAVVMFTASVLETQGILPKLGPVLALGLGILPVVEHLQFASVCFLIAGLVISIAWQRLGGTQTRDSVLFAAQRLLMFLPLGVVQSIDAWVRVPSAERNLNCAFRTFVRNWAFPIGGGCLILSLLVMANPILERVLTDLLDVEFDLQRLITRILFWMGIAFLVWPFLAVPEQRLQRHQGPKRLRPVIRFGLNAQSVSNALWVFNGLLFVQLIMDGSFVVSGELPYDMSYARYAHRGAYPLVVTALLAGCFALAARPFLDEGRWLKPLMIIWLGLNALLTVSSMYRLGIYVEAYGLTYLRIRAGIWMVLVALWLGLIAWQILKRKANGWLVFRSFVMGVGTLYVGCFVNFAEVIVSHNKGHPRHQSVSNQQFCNLMQTSKTAASIEEKWNNCSSYFETAYIEGWRDWGFREWRVARYVEQVRAERSNHENPGR
jgi:hypothetical protein